MTTPAERRADGRLVRAYKGLALLTLNTLLAFLAVNLVAALALAVYARVAAPPPGPLEYGLEKLARVYPQRAPDEIEALLRETWTRDYVYAPFVQHREPARRGSFVNVDPNGFRISAGQGAWPPAADDLTLFVFGGSTTFGYGVADDETIASRLQQRLAAAGCGAARVYNFGRGNYYSEQERVLFETLLAAGVVPDAALFVDGLNEWKEAPKFTGRLAYLLAESDARLAVRALGTLPVVELWRVRRRRAGDEAEDLQASPEEARRQAKGFVRRWLRSKRMIEAVAAEYGVIPAFVWQPVPTYRYELEHHLFAEESARSLAGHAVLRRGYELLDAERRRAPGLGEAGDFLWLADMQRGRRQPLYVDAAHYTAAFSDEIAARIAASLAPRLPCEEAAPG